MMQLVPRNNIRKCTDGNLRVTCNASPEPRLFGKVREQQYRCLPNNRELLSKSGQRVRIIVAELNVRFLLKTGKRSLVVA